jgi:hypothetical protein
MVTGGGTVSPAGVPGPGVIASNAPGCVTTATPTPVPDTAGLPPQRRTSENRRVSFRFQQELDARPCIVCDVVATFCVAKSRIGFVSLSRFNKNVRSYNQQTFRSKLLPLLALLDTLAPKFQRYLLPKSAIFTVTISENFFML